MRRRSLMLVALATGMARHVSADDQPVVLELFTSQGCSSCPPADALLGVLARRPGIIALAWHVDYWNGLGWHDPFATRLATDRQRAYAAQLHADVYTPALVLNGSALVVGSDRSAIGRAMRQVPALHVPASLRSGAAGLVASFAPVPAGTTALLAGYDPVRETAVGAGENSGRQLQEYNVVRSVSMASSDTVAAGRVVFASVPAGRGAALLLQDADLRIIGAAMLS